MDEHPLHALGFVPIAPTLADLRPARATPPPSQKEPRMKKGDRVRLADGSAARVVYVDPNLRIARVRTDHGRSVTVRRKDLRALKP